MDSRRIASALSIFAIWGTLGAEVLIPFLLLEPRTVALGLLLAIAFHFSLALLGIVNFSAVMYAALLAFVPDSTMRVMGERIMQVGWLPVLIATGVCVVLVWTVTPRYASRTCAYRARWLAWCVQFAFGISTGLAVLGIWISQRASGVGPGMQYPARHVRELLFVWAAFLLNGMAPYLGLKTEFSFAMFSNLRCEPWRHLVIPASWRPFRAWRYVALETISGLPQPAQLQNDPAAHLSLHLLSQADAYVYAPYFLRKGIERLLAVAPESRIQLRFSDATGHHDVDTRDGGLSKLSRGLPMNLFPFVLPRSADAPHSEQGSVLKSKGERQLF